MYIRSWKHPVGAPRGLSVSQTPEPAGPGLGARKTLSANFARLRWRSGFRPCLGRPRAQQGTADPLRGRPPPRRRPPAGGLRGAGAFGSQAAAESEEDGGGGGGSRGAVPESVRWDALRARCCQRLLPGPPPPPPGAGGGRGEPWGRSSRRPGLAGDPARTARSRAPWFAHDSPLRGRRLFTTSSEHRQTVLLAFFWKAAPLLWEAGSRPARALKG